MYLCMLYAFAIDISLNKRIKAVYTSDFKPRFRIKQSHFRECTFYVCLVNLQA
jgi:hypothetical protein